MDILEEINKVAGFISSHKDLLLWLDIEFYASFAILAVFAIIGFVSVKKFLLNKSVAKVGKVIAGIALCASVLVSCIMVYNILMYSKNKLDKCKILQEQHKTYLADAKLAKLKNPELEKLLADLEKQIKECIELEKKQ